MQTIFTCNAHDHGYDLVPGRDVTNAPIGRLWCEDHDQLVVRLDSILGDDGEIAIEAREAYPEDADEAAQALLDFGLVLDDDSVAAVAKLQHETPA